MDTATLMVIVGSGVCLKTLAFVGVVVRRDRRQRRALAEVTAAAAVAVPPAPAAGDPAGWRFQWSEPGVLLVENTSRRSGARDVLLQATLTTRCTELSATVERLVRFVGTGACFEARFADLEPWLAEVLGGDDADPDQVRERLACTLSFAMSWVTPEGEGRQASQTAQPVVPVPDLALETA